MPVAIALGGESVLPFGTIAPMPPGISELLIAGFLNRRGIPLVPCKTVPLRVPANAEIVIEGYVSSDAGPPGYDPRIGDPVGDGAFFEGPFGDHTGFYSLPDRYPIVEVTAVTMRRDPIYPTTIVGLPPQEDYYLGKATERIFLPLLKTLIPDVNDYDLPTFGAFHNCAMLQVHKEYPLQARRMMHSVWGAGQMAWTKTIFVVDDDVDVHDVRAVLAATSANCEPAHDIERVRGPLDILDHAAPYLGAGTKIGFDATRKIRSEECGGEPVELRNVAPAPDDSRRRAIAEDVCAIDGARDAEVFPAPGGGWLFVSLHPADPESIRERCRRILELGASDKEPFPKFIIVVGPDVDVRDLDQALFHWCANSDPGRDLIWSPDHTAIAFDATPKQPGAVGGEPVRDWPPVIKMDDDTRARVDRRWTEYGLT